MSTEKTPPQPRFRIWDVVRYEAEVAGTHFTVMGIQWNHYGRWYCYQLMNNENDKGCVGYDDSLRLVSRPGLEPQSPAETTQQKVARLKRKAMTCDDKSWLGTFAEWKEAEAGIEVADPQAQSNPNEFAQLARLLESLVERVIALEQRLTAIHNRVTPYGPRPNLFDQYAKPVVIGTACASDNKDG